MFLFYCLIAIYYAYSYITLENRNDTILHTNEYPFVKNNTIITQNISMGNLHYLM